MTNDEPGRSWRRTEGYLRAARSQVTEGAEGIFGDAINEFEEYLDHHEFRLAFETLMSIFEESPLEGPRLLELLALAAASMGLRAQQEELDARLSALRGWKYETILPEK